VSETLLKPGIHTSLSDSFSPNSDPDPGILLNPNPHPDKDFYGMILK
jgi:hypothetical protein